jgi:midasin
MHAVARCINMNWPCLLVGPALSGKSTVVRVLANCCNAHVEEIALTSASDVTELIGCFEQVDTHSMEKDLFLLLERLRDIVCHRGSAS